MPVQFAFPIQQAPAWFAAGALALGGVVWLLYRLERDRAQRLHRFVEAQLAPRLLPGFDARLRRPLLWLTVFGFAFLLLAFAQPRWGSGWSAAAREGRDLLILLDISESMNAQNPLPSRLERARQKVASLLDACPGDRFGLIVFSGTAVLQCPLTLDHAYFRSILRAVDTDILSDEGTDIAEALYEARRVFSEDEAAEEATAERAVIVLSDGEQVSGDAVRAAEALGGLASVHAIGIGDPEGTRITFPAMVGGMHSLPPDKREHLSKLDEQTLVAMARAGGGVYVRSVASNEDVARIKQELEALKTAARNSELRRRMINRYRWPLSAAFACFAAEGLWIALLPRLRQRRLDRARAGVPEATQHV
jgi:Ca-activated chloride channel family protein